MPLSPWNLLDLDIKAMFHQSPKALETRPQVPDLNVTNVQADYIKQSGSTVQSRPVLKGQTNTTTKQPPEWQSKSATASRQRTLEKTSEGR